MSAPSQHLDATGLDDGPEDRDALRADIYRLLASLLLAAPDRELLAMIAGLEADADGGPLAARWRALAEAAAATTPEALSRAHFRHLVGVIAGEVTPYASWYRHGTLMDEPLVALRRDLRRLGIERDAHSRDPEDHLAALCEAMAMLIEDRSPAQAAFFQAHLQPWAGRCLGDLAGVETPFYARLGRLGQAFLDLEQNRAAAASDHEPIRVIDDAPG